MKDFASTMFSEKTKRTVLTVVSLILFAAALVCAVIALTKKAPVTPVGPSHGSTDDPSGPSGPITPPSSDKITTLSEITSQISYVDPTGSLPISDVATLLLTQLINTASSDKTAYSISKINSITPVIFDYTMDTSSICKAPLSASVWFVSATASLVYDGTILVDSNGDAFVGGRYIVKNGKNYTLYAQSIYENMTPSEVDPFVWGEFDPATTIASAEMTLSCGVKLGMTYNEVETLMHGLDTLLTESARVRTATKSGYTFTFSLVDNTSTSANDWGLARTGDYYLTAVTADESCKDEFPRGIKIGDTIESVFTKFPTASTKLQQWKMQRLYGASEYKKNTVICYLEYRTYLGNYRIFAQDTGREAIGIVFSRENTVKAFEWIYQQ